MVATHFPSQNLWPLLWKQLFFIFSLYRFSSAQDNSTTCGVPWVEPLADTSITCHLPTNVNQLNAFFGVSFESDKEKKSQDILDCGWHPGKMVCSIYRPGYKYDNTTHVSNKFSLEILQASAEHIGTYKCFLVNIHTKNNKPCEFRVKVVGKTMCVISSQESKTRTSLTCYYPEDLNKTRTNFTVYHYSRTGSAEVIMACEWKGDNLTCIISHGYEFDDRVSDYLTLKIPMALESLEGAYSCHISGARLLHYDLCTVTPEKSDAVNSTCQIPSVEEAEPTALTCKFSVDVNRTKSNFTVVHHSDGNSTAVAIINCTWLGDHLTCDTAQGYQFNNTVTDDVIIQVPQSSHNHSGMYACYVMGTVSRSFEPCEFNIRPATTSFCNISSVQEMEARTLTCTFNVDINMTKRNFAVVHLGGQDRKGADVINCTWMNEQLNCTTAPGYEFNKTVTDHFSMKISQISNEHSGIYTCHVLGSRINGFKPCELIITPGGDTGRSTVSDQFFLHYLLIAVGVILMCIPLSLIIVIIVMRMKNTSHINERNRLPNEEHMSAQSLAPHPVSEDIDNVDESTPMIQREHGGRDHETCESSVDEGMVRNPTEIVDTNQKAYQEQDIGRHSSIQSEVDEGRNHRTFPQSGSRNKDTQPSSNGDLTGNDKTQDGLRRHSPVQSDAHEEAGNQTSLQSDNLDTQPPAKGNRKASLESEAIGKMMSVTSQKKKKSRQKKNVTTEECLLPITDTEAALLAMKITHITQNPENKKTILEQLHKDWLEWVEATFPDLDSRSYFLPPVYFNRVPRTLQSIVGQDVLMLHSTSEHPAAVAAAAAAAAQMSFRVQESDLRDDAARQRVLFCLQEMFKFSREGLFAISQLRFEDYLNGARSFAEAVEIPLPHKTGIFGILLIHQNYGVVVCEVKSLGLNLSSNEINNQIKKKLQQCVSQLDKAEAMLSHLVSDIAPGLRITKTIAFPNLTTHQVQQAILNDDKLNQDLSTCLRTTDCNNVAGLFLTSDQLSDPTTPWDVSSEVMKKLENWWQNLVTADGHDSHMSSDIYKKLMTRFCGPATNVTVQYTSNSRHCVKTLGQAVSLTGERNTAVITLFPEQVHLLSERSSRLFVAGPPGTGKTVVLQLKGVEWLQYGDVYIVSTWVSSRAACTFLHDRLLKHASSDSTVILKQYDLKSGTDVENAVKELSEATDRKPLMVIADEVGPDGSGFKTFCEQLMDKFPHLHLWAASCYHGYSPQGWPVEYLTRPLRCPPAVVREVKQASEIEKGNVREYSDRCVPDHTDGPPVKRLYHRGQGHSGDLPVDCGKCGEEVASFLHSLHVGVVQTTSNTTAIFSSGSAAPHALRWSDVLVLYHDAVSDSAGVVTALRTAGIPVQVKRWMKDDDIKDLVSPRRDVVWVLGGYHVHGLERKVVVCLDPEASSENPTMDVGFRLHYMSRCTSQLVIVSSGD
ncbi:uncharacterized protein LOC112575042 isoform X2 [Pomacea canaliculata]|uniref:uncharacterized protein LOC112575042 isoform X2 n=1 Tax=Pomacea canaliculata TaxID=400727 RepID=UPI000D73AE5C|nr:uncharacterized protein LOC112575042 isoform X2 [Pomacea canaliculata]